MIFLFLSSLSDEHAANSPKAPPAREIADPENDFPELDELLRRAKEGDGDAFSDLVVHYERFVYNTAVRVLSASGQSSDLADDIAQDSFIKAWRNLTQFRGECTFSTWLFRVTVNTAKDAIRSAARRPTVSLSYPDGDDEDGYAEWDVPVTSGGEIPEEVLEKKELILGVRRAVEALPEEQRQVVVMRDLHGLSYQEISDTLGVELGTVKSRLNRGRTNLKILLENGNFL